MAGSYTDNVDEERGAEPVPLRASDADRERVAQLLHTATADGRLSLLEMEDRLRSVYQARTLAELAPLTQDLTPRPAVAEPAAARLPGAPVSDRAWAVLSHADRRGQWLVPARFTVGSVLGSATLDLRHAIFLQRHVTIVASTIMGSIEIIVPDDVDAVVDGTGILGTFDSKAPQLTPAHRGSVRVVGFALLGSVLVRPASKRERRRAGS